MFGWALILSLTALLLLFMLLYNSLAFEYFKCDERVQYQNAITVLMPTFNRNLDVVKQIILHYEMMNCVSSVIVLEFDEGHKTNHATAVHMPNDLRLRFSAHKFPYSGKPLCPQILSDAVITVDDDCVLQEPLLQSLYSRLLTDPTALHGIEGRNVIRGEYMPYDRPNVQPGGVEVYMLLTWCAMAKTSRMKEVEEEFRANYFDYCKRLNGEDIAISRIFRKCVMHEFGWVTFRRKPIINTHIRFMTNEYSLSGRKNFLKDRQEVVERFSAVNLTASPSAPIHAPPSAPIHALSKETHMAYVLAKNRHAITIVLALTIVVVFIILIHHTHLHYLR
jgi:hypothetical protein